MEQQLVYFRLDCCCQCRECIRAILTFIIIYIRYVYNSIRTNPSTLEFMQRLHGFDVEAAAPESVANVSFFDIVSGLELY